MAKRVFGVGRVILDHVVVLPTYPECDTKCLVSEHWQQVGGPVPVALSTAAYYGIETTYLGAWGEDAAGLEIAKTLSKRRIDISCCHTSGVSGFAQIWTEATTGKRTVAAHPGDEIREHGLSQYDDAIEKCQILHLDGSSAAAARYAATKMKGQGGIVVLDAGSKKPGMQDLLPLVDLLIASEQFCRTWFGSVDVPLAELQKLNGSAVIRTRGAEGATYFDGKSEFHQAAMKIKSVDTNGAGDIFCGAFLKGLAEGWELTRSFEFASKVAGHSCQFKGNTCLPDLPAG